jgi:rRNA maturation RNase YbeY
METGIDFISHEISFDLEAKDSVSNWILRFVSAQGKEIQSLEYIFCSDEYLLELNREHLDHDYYTDILTFPYAPPEAEMLLGEIYISVDRVKENAESFQESFQNELHRVMIHGVLHLLGQDDHGEEEEVMRQREQAALGLREF